MSQKWQKQKQQTVAFLTNKEHHGCTKSMKIKRSYNMKITSWRVCPLWSGMSMTNLHMMELNTIHIKPLHTIKVLILSSHWNLTPEKCTTRLHFFTVMLHIPILWGYLRCFEAVGWSAGKASGL